jgi:hypothetical protein
VEQMEDRLPALPLYLQANSTLALAQTLPSWRSRFTGHKKDALLSNSHQMCTSEVKPDKLPSLSQATA